MALRFKRTIDVSRHMFSTRQHADTDWVLYCGGWQVGRIHENLRPVEPRMVFVWSLTGPVTPEAPVATRGEALTVAAAKGQLTAAMRAWAIWAGLRTADSSAPQAPRWAQEGDEWRLLSGGFVAGRVHWPTIAGRRHKPHWQLLTSGPMQMPAASTGPADRIDQAKAELLSAWQAWREWAELESPADRSLSRGDPQAAARIESLLPPHDRISCGMTSDNQTNFLMCLQGAKAAFENGVAAPPGHAKASFDSLLFECARAVRIARDAREDIKALGIDPEEFLAFMKDVAQHRNVAEHWRDAINPRKLTQHEGISRQGITMSVDESALIYMGPTEVYVGKLNLHDVYQYVAAKLVQAGR